MYLAPNLKLLLVLCAVVAGLSWGAAIPRAVALSNCTVTGTDLAIDSEEADFLLRINSYRTENGKAMLSLSTNLNRAAAWMAQDMGQRNYFSHTDSASRDPSARARACDYPGNAGENIAAGTVRDSGLEAFAAWQASSGHNANMLNSNYKYIGIGRAYVPGSTYGWYWVTDFGIVNDGTNGEEAPPLTAPTAPGYDRAISASGNLQLHWTDLATTEQGYLVYRIGAGASVQVGGNLPSNSASVSDSGLASNTTYYYQVYAWNSLASVFPGTYMAARTLSNAPKAPTVMSGWAVGSDGIRLAWADNSNNEQGFRIQRWTGSGFELAGTVGPNVTTFTDGGLPSGTSYYYIVQSYNQDGATDSLAGISAMTRFTNPSNGPGPAGPTFAAARTTGSTVELNWVDNSDNEQYYNVYRLGAGTATLIATLNANATSFTDIGRSPDAQYAYQIYAWNPSGSTPAEGFLTASTTPSKPVPPAVQSLAAQSPTSMKLTWVDRSSNEVGFKILRYNGTSFDLAGTVGVNVTSFVDGGRAPNTSYVYLVAAYNSFGETYAPAGIWAPTLP